MLKGYLRCADINKMLLSYVHFELSKNDMDKVAQHLRNCPICMEKYTKIQKRKNELKNKMQEIENNLRMQNEISAYIDKEAGDDIIFIVEGMLLSDENYRKELLEDESLRELLCKSKRRLIRTINADKTQEIIKNLRRKQAGEKIIKRKIIRLVAPLHHVFLKSQ